MRPSLPLLVALYVPVLLVLAFTRWVLHSRAPDVVAPVSLDPVGMLHHSSISAIGILLWASATIVALFGALRSDRSSNRSLERFSVGAAFISLLFLVDDVFQLHKPVLPRATGLTSGALLAAYAAIVVLWLVCCRKEVGRTEVAVLGVALGFFAIWLGYKLVPGLPAPTPAEISTKLCGVAGWTLYVWRSSFRVSSRSGSCGAE